MRMTGIIMMWVGFLSAAFFAMRQLGTVEWVPFGLCAAIGVVGVVLIRRSANAGATDTVKVSADLATLESRLASVNERLGVMIEGKASIDVYDVRHKIDDELAVALEEFAEARESMVHGLGMETYAAVMDRFARGERFVNRAWSASADGYIDEVWNSLDTAIENLRMADDTLRAAMARL